METTTSPKRSPITMGAEKRAHDTELSYDNRKELRREIEKEIQNYYEKVSKHPDLQL
jgi:hypothetical protein